MMWLKPKVGLHNKRNFEKSRNYNNEYWVHFTRFFCNIWHFYWRFVSDKLLTRNYHIYLRGVIDSVLTIYNWGFPLLRNAYALQNDKNTSSYDTTTIVAQHYCQNMITCSYLWCHSSNIVTMRRLWTTLSYRHKYH